MSESALGQTGLAPDVHGFGIAVVINTVHGEEFTIYPELESRKLGHGSQNPVGLLEVFRNAFDSALSRSNVFVIKKSLEHLVQSGRVADVLCNPADKVQAEFANEPSLGQTGIIDGFHIKARLARPVQIGRNHEPDIAGDALPLFLRIENEQSAMCEVAAKDMTFALTKVSIERKANTIAFAVVNKLLGTLHPHLGEINLRFSDVGIEDLVKIRRAGAMRTIGELRSEEHTSELQSLR